MAQNPLTYIWFSAFPPAACVTSLISTSIPTSIGFSFRGQHSIPKQGLYFTPSSMRLYLHNVPHGSFLFSTAVSGSTFGTWHLAQRAATSTSIDSLLIPVSVDSVPRYPFVGLTRSVFHSSSSHACKLGLSTITFGRNLSIVISSAPLWLSRPLSSLSDA